MEYPRVKVIVTENRGRGLAAARSVARGEELLVESAAVVGPVQSDEICCVSCSRPQRTSEQLFLHSCPECDMPKCQSCGPHDPESCGALSRARGSPRSRKSISRWLSVARILSKRSTSPNLYDRILGLEDNLEKRGECGVMARNREEVVPVMRSMFPGVEEAEVLRICGILDSNAFKLDVLNGIRGLFVLAAMVNHDCCPNCRVYFDRQQNLHLLAKRDIDEGEELTITYCSPLMSTAARSEKLLRSKFFTCDCGRCSDPTEMGSHLGSLLCPKCRVGLVVPGRFRCNECPFSTTREKAERLTEVVKQIHDKELSRGKKGSTRRAEKLEELLQKHSRSLPTHHYLLLDLKVELMNDLAAAKSSMALADGERALELLAERMRVLAAVDGGGESRLMGFLHFKRHELLVGKLLHLQKEDCCDLQSMLTSAAREMAPRLSESLSEAWRLLGGDAGCPEGLTQSVKMSRNMNQSGK